MIVRVTAGGLSVEVTVATDKVRVIVAVPTVLVAKDVRAGSWVVCVTSRVLTIVLPAPKAVEVRNTVLTTVVMTAGKVRSRSRISQENKAYL